MVISRHFKLEFALAIPPQMTVNNKQFREKEGGQAALYTPL